MNVLDPYLQQGSLGASGDLAPLSHLALALIGEGKVLYRGEEKDSDDVLRELKTTFEPSG